MDAVQKETSGETLEPERIVVPPEITKPFGGGLKQIISVPMQEITSTIKTLERNPEHHAKRITTIKEQFTKITYIVNGLEKAKKVEVISFEGGNEFRFSEETEDVNPNPGEVIMNEDIAPKFIIALFHTIRNPLNIVLGNAENIQTEKAAKIVSSSKKIEEAIRSFTGARKIKMLTDANGNTTITPIRASS